MVKLYLQNTLFEMVDKPKWPLSKITVYSADKWPIWLQNLNDRS